jgi:hypothetical protein
MLLICLCIIPLLVEAIIGLSIFSTKARAQGDGIIVVDADYNLTITAEYSADLINITKNVVPRIVMEYGDFNSKLDLNKSDDLSQAASIVSSRITVEYADFISTYGLNGSETLTQIAITVTPRIIVEYADFIFSTNLGPKPMKDNTPPVIENVFQQPASDSVYPYDKVEVYANVTDDLSGVKQVILNYTTDNGTWFSEEMTNLEDTVYNATIPEFPYCTNVTYIIIAEDNANNTVTTEGMGYQYHVIPEFPSFIIVPLFMIATLTASIIYRRKHSKQPQKPINRRGIT